MPPKPKKKAKEPAPAPPPKVDVIKWQDNESALVWALLSELEDHENYRVLFGKKDAAEASSFLS